MNGITSLSIQMYDDGYCSQPGTSLRPVRNIEEGVKLVEDILKRDILCRHDIKQINKIYRTIDHLERQASQIPEYNSQCVLEKIVEKIEKIARDKNLLGLISLYHLQNFSDKELSIEKHCQTIWKSSPRCDRYKKSDPETIKQIATYLPCCDSEKHFDHDVSRLIGPCKDEEVKQILSQKRGKLQSFVKMKEEVEKRRVVLTTHSQNYPAYFDELLDNGYIHLYDHLIQMRALPDRETRKSEIENVTFSFLSHIVLETRAAIIQKVKISIPDHQRNILFLIGGTGAGKSTTLCFLRGDEMMQLKDDYASKSDQNGLIGHKIAASCTFLPTIEDVNDWIIVDFPGFDDTNGSLVCLGIECALKALIKEYRPKVLVLESITNKEGRFHAAKQLGFRLTRLLSNKEDCVLGITKYSKDPDIIEITSIETKQREEQLQLTQEELELMGVLEMASEFNIPEDTQRDMQHQLAKMHQVRAEKLKLPLPETDLKAERRKCIKEKEEELLKQIGLKSFIRLDNLTDLNHVSSCLATLSDKKRVQVCSQHLLDADDVRLLAQRFRNNLVVELEKKTDYQNFKDFEAFKQTVLESSLISAIYSHSNPEIGQFLHLPEIDPDIVQAYDKDIVGHCIKKFIESVVCTIDLFSIEKMLEELQGRGSQEDIVQFQTKLNRLLKYIFDLLAEELPKDKADIKKVWAIKHREFQTALYNIEWEPLMPHIMNSWTSPVAIVLLLTICVPMDFLEKYKKKKKLTSETINTCCMDLDQLYDILLKLKELEKLIQEKNAMEKAFKSVQISTKSIENLYTSIRERINQVRAIYGDRDWDNRVAFLVEKFRLGHFFCSDTAIFPFLSAYAYLLIEPGLSYEISINKASDKPKNFKFFVDKQSILTNTCVVSADAKANIMGKRDYVNSTSEFFSIINSKVTINLKGGRIEIEGLGYILELPGLEQLVNENFLVNRALFAAAFLKAQPMCNFLKGGIEKRDI